MKFFLVFVYLLLISFGSVSAMLQEGGDVAAGQQKVQYRNGVLIFLDDSEQENKAITSLLLYALVQEAGPIIVSGSLLWNIFVNPDSRMKEFREALAFDKDKWIIKDITTKITKTKKPTKRLPKKPLEVKKIDNLPQNIKNYILANGLKKDQDVNAIVTEGIFKGSTALNLVIISGKTEMVKALVEVGADVNAIVTEGYNKGFTALHQAVALNEMEVVKALVEAGADVNAIVTEGYDKGKTPFALAKSLEIIDILKQYGARKGLDDGMLYLLLPQNYLDKKDVSFDAVHNIVTFDSPVTETELKLGFRVNHMQTVSDLASFSFCSSRAFQFADYFIDNLSSIFCAKSDFKDNSSLLLPLFSIYLAGHGMINKSIAHLSLDQFKKFLNFLEHKINTKLLYYLSCYAAGVNIQNIYADSVNIQKTYPFAIIAGALTDAVSYGFNMELKILQLIKTNPLDVGYSYLKFEKFIEESTREEVDYTKVIKSVTNLTEKQATAQIKLPGLEWFSVVDVARGKTSKGQSSQDTSSIFTIGSVLGKTRTQELHLGESVKIVLLYAQDVKFPLVLDSMPAFVSMVPGDVIHRFSSIKFDKPWRDFLDFSELFTQVTSLIPMKLFFVKKIQYKNNLLENVIIYKPKHEKAPCEKELYYCTYLLDGEEYFVNAFLDHFQGIQRISIKQPQIIEAEQILAEHREESSKGLLSSSLTSEGAAKVSKMIDRRAKAIEFIATGAQVIIDLANNIGASGKINNAVGSFFSSATPETSLIPALQKLNNTTRNILGNEIGIKLKLPAEALNVRPLFKALERLTNKIKTSTSRSKSLFNDTFQLDDEQCKVVHANLYKLVYITMRILLRMLTDDVGSIEGYDQEVWCRTFSWLKNPDIKKP